MTPSPRPTPKGVSAHLTLEICQSDPIAGCLQGSAGGRRRFKGWIELSSAIAEEVRLSRPEPSAAGHRPYS